LNTIALIPAFTDLTIIDVEVFRQSGLAPLAAINAAQSDSY